VIAYSDALAAVRALGAARPLDEEKVALAAAAGRVLAREAVSGESVPGFDNSGMDGFAVRAADVAGASARRPVVLPVRGSLAAGDDAAQVERGGPGAIEIMTGAPLPAGYDAVVPVEDVEVARDDRRVPVEIALRAPVEPGRHVRPAGEDFRPGDAVAAAGTVLRPEQVAALATLGIAEVAVRRRPRFAIVATGKEVVPHTARTLAPGTLRNSSTPYVVAALAPAGVEWVGVHSIGDEPEALRRALVAARDRGADVVLTTGAVSAGKLDFVPAVLARLDARAHFHKVAVKPGKPVLCAELPGGPAVFGLPGNPVATAVALRFLVVPFLREALGLGPERPLLARLAGDTKKPQGLRNFVKARLALTPAGPQVTVLEGQGSAIVRSLLAANAWAILPEAAGRVAAGTEVEVVPQPALSGGWAGAEMEP
jgi:molybdopterin molybdotransferase